MRQFGAVTVIGRDKTGVVARVTAFLSEQRASLEAPEEPVTRSQFRMMLQASWFASDCHAAGVPAGLDKLARQPCMEIKFRCFRPKRRPRFAIMAIREPPDFEALMIAPYRREIKAGPGARPGPSPRPRTTRPKIQTAVCPHPGNNTRCACSKRRRLISWYCTVHGNSPAQPREAVQKHDHQPSPPSWLLSFPGPQTFERSVKIAGVTVHFVAMRMDVGPIITQDSFKIHPGMTLKDIVTRGRQLKTEALVKAVKLYPGKRLDVHWAS
jgi:formyltetrahydrofolate deformylase